MEDTVKQRLKSYIQHKNISVRQFCIKIGASPAFVSNIVTSIQPDKIDSIAKHFPDLNTGWLMTGEGEMLKGEIENREKKITQQQPTDLANRFLDALERCNQQLRESMEQTSRLISVIERMQGNSKTPEPKSPPLKNTQSADKQ